MVTMKMVTLRTIILGSGGTGNSSGNIAESIGGLSLALGLEKELNKKWTARLGVSFLSASGEYFEDTRLMSGKSSQVGF